MNVARPRVPVLLAFVRHFMVVCRHVDRRRRPAEFLRPAAWHVVARRFIGRGIRALAGAILPASVCSASAMRHPISACFARRPSAALRFMPAGQGVVKWPTTRPALSALVDEDELPLADSAVDRVMLVHALEMTNDPGALLREVWRVLASGGRLLAVVPNRRGLWARMDTTPFGHGRPYSRSADQSAPARDLVHANRLERSPLRAAGRARLVSCGRRSRGSARARRVSAPFAGVHLVEATKQVYRAIPARARKAAAGARRWNRALAPSPGG